MPEQPKRHYSNIEDSVMLEECQTMHDLFEEDQAEFEDFDSDFINPFEDNWQDAIDAAESYPTDEVIQDQITQATALVEAKMKLCRDKFQGAKYFISKAFPKNTGLHNEFGFNDYDRVRNNQSKMILFMDRLHKTAVEYNTELIAAGYIQTDIDEINTLQGQLKNANRDQEIKIRKRGTATQTRIGLLNAAWDFMTKTAKAAKIIYKDNYAKFNEYLLPGRANEPDVAFTLGGLIRAAPSQNPVPGASVTAVGTGITVNSDNTGAYGMVLPDGTYSILVERDGFISQTLNNVVIANGELTELDVDLVPV